MTNEQHKEVIKFHKDGKSYREIANYFGVNKNTIRGIIKRSTTSKK